MCCTPHAFTAASTCQASCSEDVERAATEARLGSLCSCRFGFGSSRQAWIRRAVREGSQTGALFRLCPLAQAAWLRKTAQEIKRFKADEALCDVSCLKLRVCEHGWQVSSWVRAALEADNYAEEVQEIVGTLKQQKVKGTALMDLTYERLVAEPYKIAGGPAGNLAKRIAAVSAQPMAASGFQARASAEIGGVPWGHWGSL